MRLLGTMLIATLALAVAAAVVKLIALAIILAALVAVLTRPRETLAIATTIGVLNLFALYPIIMIALAGAGLACRLFKRGSGMPKGEWPQLPKPDE